MYWGNPNVLLALWIVPLLIALLIYAERKRRATSARFADGRMMTRLVPSRPGARPWLKGGVFLAGLVCLLVAGARPRFGFHFEEVTTHGVDLFVLLDVSRSMLAEDVAPSRLERAKSDIRDLLQRLVGDRAGLIVFAGAPVVEVPLTTDHGFFLNALDTVSTESAPRGGSLIGDAIRKAVELMDQHNDHDRVLVLITDGEDHDSYPAEAAKAAAERGVKIFTVGLGSPEDGARIPLDAKAGDTGFVKYNGQEVWSRMDERLLKEIALTTGGAYIPARTAYYDLGELYEDHLSKLTRGEQKSERRKRYHERFQLFVCLGLGLWLAEMLIGRYPSPAPRSAKTAEPVGSS